jgi:hypothetical protein
MAIRLVAAALFGGLSMFLWLSLANMSPLGDIGISPLPREFLITSTLEAGAGGTGGLYMFPAVPETNTEVPSGFMVFHPDNIFFGSMGNRIALELFKDVIQSTILTLLIVWAGICGFFSRLGFSACAGLLAAATTNLSLAIWYGFPIAYALGAAGITLGGYLAAGISIALILPRRSYSAHAQSKS